MSATTTTSLKEMKAAVYSLEKADKDKYVKIVTDLNGGTPMAKSSLINTTNRELLERVYAVINKLPGSKTSAKPSAKPTTKAKSLYAYRESDFVPSDDEDEVKDADDEDDDDVSSVASSVTTDPKVYKRLDNLETQIRKLKVHTNTQTSAQNTTPLLPIKAIRDMTGKAMNDHIDGLKQDYGVDAFKASIERITKDHPKITTMTDLKNAKVVERAPLIVKLQNYLEHGVKSSK